MTSQSGVSPHGKLEVVHPIPSTFEVSSSKQPPWMRAIYFPIPFLAAVSLALGSIASAMTLEEAMKDAPSCIFYDTAPYSLGYHAGLASLVTYGSLILISASIAIIAKCTGSTRRRRTSMVEKSNPPDFLAHNQLA
ncbi:hypothetical protein EGR_08786 [Echinococcus granulosus]|uniref:Uncharacterized protein n=1 Tax=Echinococcus granulosus TaxID=6210 RepID=W6U5F9_ECHGR|nr:hypothetical protein EGR_08786 [Echinococcus granulosus]EUB56360.1 hypothetical protein EGR_08786 [Echinococcus granulosus]